MISILHDGKYVSVQAAMKKGHKGVCKHPRSSHNLVNDGGMQWYAVIRAYIVPGCQRITEYDVMFWLSGWREINE